MESVKFELTIKKFFEKAGVVLLKKGVDFSGGDDVASFMLLDTKRKSFYLTETDIPDDTDFEINAVSEYFPADMPANVKAAVLRLGRADSRDYIPMPELYSLEGYIRKSALIISENDAPKVTSFFGAEDVTFQSVPFKGGFMVYFLDKTNSKKVISIYEKASNALRDHGKEDKAADAAEVLMAISEPSATLENPAEKPDAPAAFSFDNLISGVPSDVPVKSQSTEPNDEELLANIDLTKLIPPSTEDTPESQEEADLMYAKILNEQLTTNEASLSEPRKRDISEIPKDIIAETKDDTTSAEDERQEQALLNKKDAYEPKPKQTSKGAKGRLASSLAGNAAGFIFFTPAYLLGKGLSRFFPPFVIYWLAAIAVIFGVYQYMWMIPGGMFYDALLAPLAGQSAQLFNIASQIADGDMAQSLIAFSGIMFAGLMKAADGLSSGWLLRYLAAFGAVMMIFPYGRAFGARITVFSFLSYFAAPLMITAQAFAINSAAAMFTAQSDALAAAAAGIFASVFFIPVIAVILLLIISGWLVPDRAKCETEVLP